MLGISDSQGYVGHSPYNGFLTQPTIRTGILAQPARPDDPVGTCTCTRKYLYPERGYGYFRGTGTGSPGMTPGLPVRQPSADDVARHREHVQEGSVVGGHQKTSRLLSFT